MTVPPSADLDSLKTRIRATWMAGDYGSVAALTESAAKDFIDRRQINGVRRADSYFLVLALKQMRLIVEDFRWWAVEGSNL